jgi:predicted AAA+ superfamily ATPase
MACNYAFQLQSCTKAFEEMHLSVLEATYQIVVLRPYFANVAKRLVKTPKVYYASSGQRQPRF